MAGRNDKLIGFQLGRAVMAVAVLLALLGVQVSAAPTSAKRFSADTLTVEQIETAVDAAIEAVYTQSRLQPRYTPVPEYVFRTSSFHVPQEIRNMMGNNALISWALLACGESYQNPRIYKRINWVLASDQPQVYGRSMRLQMLAELPRARWRAWSHRDSIWLNGAITDKGNFGDIYYGIPLKGYGDNANGQYGVLGLWGSARAGNVVKADTWKQIEKYWVAAQEKATGNEPAGWAVYSFDAKADGGTENTFNRRVSGPMTAGGVAVLCLTERFLRGPRMITPGEQHVSEPLRRGIRWLDNSFSLTDKAEETDRYYYFWTTQRVGHATGYKSFNGVDLFRDIAATMLNEQRADGTWSGPKGQLLSTAFALLYLSRAYDPLAISKIRYETKDNKGDKIAGAWNNRPHDLWNFVDYISDQYEYTTSWQIVELDLSPYSLIESPLLWLATHDGFSFTDQQITNLRDYINAGGMLVFNPDRVSPGTGKSITALAAKLYPDLKFEKVRPDHGFYKIHQRIKSPIPMQMVHNGIRPLIVQFNRDIGRGLQENDVVTSDSFRMLSNIYLYAVGMNYRRARLINSHIPRINKSPSRNVSAARLKHSGNFDPEPGALAQMQNLMANKHNMNLQVEVIDGKALSSQSIAFLTTNGTGTLNDADAAAIKKWVEGGGLLVIDAASGLTDAAKNAERLLKQIFPDQPNMPLASDHPVLSADGIMDGYDCRWVQFRNFALRTMGPVNRPRVQGVEVNGRIGVIYSTEDLTCGMAGLDHWDIFGYTPDFSRKIAANAILLSAQIR